MGYSKSPSTLRRIEESLAPLTQGEDCVWNTDDPHEWAYKVREALYIARLHPDQFPALAVASATYIVGIEDETHVYAKRIEPAQEAILVPRSGAQQPPRRQDAVKRVLAEAFGFPDIVQFWIDCQPSNELIRVLNAPLSDGELQELAGWAMALNPPWMVLRPKGTLSLTIAPNDTRVPVDARILPPEQV